MCYFFHSLNSCIVYYKLILHTINNVLLHSCTAVLYRVKKCWNILNQSFCLAAGHKTAADCMICREVNPEVTYAEPRLGLGLGSDDVGDVWPKDQFYGKVARVASSIKLVHGYDSPSPCDIMQIFPGGLHPAKGSFRLQQVSQIMNISCVLEFTSVH